MTEVVLIRHGETVWNREGRMQGFDDSPLTEKGVRQAEATAAALSAQRFDAVYASPQGRAKRTAEIIANPHDLHIEYRLELRERNLGVMQGLTLEEVRHRYPDVYAAFGDPGYVIPNGESSEQRFSRGNRCLQELAGIHPGERIIVVTHGGIVDGVFRKIFALPLDRPRSYSLFNCAVNRIGVNDREWRLLTWGDVHHLSEIGSLDDK
jgi:probable phosphoglycerate mutase